MVQLLLEDSACAEDLRDSLCYYHRRGQREVAQLRGHEGPVQQLALSPDGETLATCSDDQTVRLWRLSTQERERFFAATTAGCRMWPSRRWDAAGQCRSKGSCASQYGVGSEGWDVARGANGPPSRPEGRPWHLLPWERVLAYSAPGGDICLWDAAAGRSKHASRAILVRPSSSPSLRTARRSASAGDNALKLWDVSAGKELASFAREGCPGFFPPVAHSLPGATLG